MKKKGIFLSVFIILLTVMSLTVCSLYDARKIGTLTSEDSISDSLKDEMNLLIIYLAGLENKDYEAVTFEDTNLSEDEIDMLSQDINETITSQYLYLYNSGYITYKVENKNINRTFESDEQCNQESSLFYGKLEFDDQGNMTTSKNYPYATNIYSYFANFVYELMLNYDLEYEYSHVHIHLPQNVSMSIGVSQDCLTDVNFINTYGEVDHGFTIVSLLAGTVILGLLLLFVSVDVVKEVEPFAFIRKLKLELNLAILSIITPLLILWILLLSNITLTGKLSELLSSYGKELISPLTLGINFISWFVVFLVIAIDIFDVKYILVNLKEYFIDNSMISSLYRFIKRRVHYLLDIDLSKSLDKRLLLVVFIQMIIMIVFSLLFGVGVILSIVYAVVLFVIARKYLLKVQKDYQELLEITHSMSEGHLNIDIQTDLDLFNSYKNELQLVRQGFKKAVDEEVKSNKMKTELITNVSHDLKTPLTGLRNYVELLQEDTLDIDTRKEYVLKLEHYVLKLSTLIEDLFEISKVNSGNIQLNKLNIDVLELLYQTQSELEEQLSAKELDIIINHDQEHYFLCLDNQKTYRIFENLLMNISKYALAHTRVYIDIDESEDDVCIIFKNISEQSLNFNTDEIVERFTRGDKSRNSEGSGLGLAIVKSFVEVQGGTFHIETDGDLFKAIIHFSKEVKDF